MPKKVYSPSSAADLKKANRNQVKVSRCQGEGRPRLVRNQGERRKNMRKFKADYVRHSVIPTGDCW